MARENFGLYLFFIASLHFFIKTKGLYVPITIDKDAAAKGAVCLDGSPPAYHLSKGFDAGIDSWLIQLEGGGWCNNVTTCLRRKDSRLGSSLNLLPELAFSAILSDKAQYNPDFFNWNRIKIRYCDGSSFTGDVEAVDPVTKLHFRGGRIFRAVIDSLLDKGMKNAKNAILSGCSAGGLGSILQCDNFKSLLPKTTKVKCISDAGYFINAKDILGAQITKDYFSDVVATHGSAGNLPKSCTSKMKPEMCFFAENVVKHIQTPIFLVNTAYDSWQIKSTLAPFTADPKGVWLDCKRDIKKCSPDQLKKVQDFRAQVLSSLSGLGSSKSRGLFINSCYNHCQTEMQEVWFTPTSPRLSKTPIAKAVGDWFYDKTPFQKIDDCPYPCNPTCINRVYDM